MEETQVLIIGGGAAGMAAAVAARRKGYRKILVADRRDAPGGVLLQCSHKGFGLGFYKEDLTGMEYAERFAEVFRKTSARTIFSTSVLQVRKDRTALLSGKYGRKEVRFERCVFACGCRERSINSLEIAGSRPAGILTAGIAQKLMNIDGLNAGDDVVILGSGDIGQIVARQLVQAGKRVIAMIEIEPEPGGRKKNHEECLREYRIPLLLNSTITRIHGNKRITGVTVADRNTGEETILECRTLLTAVGLIPEMELARDITENGGLPSWAFKTGNCDYVHDIVDSVTFEALKLERVL